MSDLMNNLTDVTRIKCTANYERSGLFYYQLINHEDM